MATSLTLCIQLSTLIIQHAACQFPTMLGMQGIPSMSQMGSYPTQIQSPQYYEETHIKPNKKKKNKSKRKRKPLRRTMSSSSESSESDYVSEDCSCENTCDQCNAPQQSGCCESFCDTCTPNMNQGIVFVPYPYPLVITNLQQKNKENERKENDKSDGSKEESDKKPDKPEHLDENTTQRQKTTERATETIVISTPSEFTKLTEKPTTKLLRSENRFERNKNTNINQNDVDLDVIKILLDAQPKKLNQQELDFGDIVFKVPNQGNNKFMLTSTRRVKQNWMPKYGIVPIPEKVASNLMTQLRSMKVLQAHGDTQALTATNNPNHFTDIYSDKNDQNQKKNMPIELVNKIYHQ